MSVQRRIDENDKHLIVRVLDRNPDDVPAWPRRSDILLDDLGDLHHLNGRNAGYGVLCNPDDHDAVPLEGRSCDVRHTVGGAEDELGDLFLVLLRGEIKPAFELEVVTLGQVALLCDGCHKRLCRQNSSRRSAEVQFIHVYCTPHSSADSGASFSSSRRALQSGIRRSISSMKRSLWVRSIR